MLLTAQLQEELTIWLFDKKNIVFCSSTGMEEWLIMVENNAMLRRKSMELLEELTQILRRIIGSGDEQSLNRLQETIRDLYMKVVTNPLTDFTNLIV